MESIKLQQHVGQDGILHLDIPVGMTEEDVEVMVVYHPASGSATPKQALEQLYGICADDPIILDNQGISESADDKLAEAFD